MGRQMVIKSIKARYFTVKVILAHHRGVDVVFLGMANGLGGKGAVESSWGIAGYWEGGRGELFNGVVALLGGIWILRDNETSPRPLSGAQRPIVFRKLRVTVTYRMFYLLRLSGLDADQFSVNGTSSRTMCRIRGWVCHGKREFQRLLLDGEGIIPEARLTFK